MAPGNPAVGLRAQVGAALRRARLELGWSQREVVAAAGVSQTLLALVEAGRRGASLDSIERIAEVLGVEVAVRAPLILGRDGQHDAAHARCVTALRRLLEREGQVCATEQPVGDGRIRGWIDLMSLDRARRRLAIIEVKTVIRDAGALERQVDLYARTCLARARQLGWRPVEVFVVVAALTTAENDAFVIANRDAMRHDFPVRGRAGVAMLLDGAPIGGRGLVAMDPRRRGRRMLTLLAADGRRTPAPYQDYADFMACLRDDVGRRTGTGTRNPGRARPTELGRATRPRRPGPPAMNR